MFRTLFSKFPATLVALVSLIAFSAGGVSAQVQTAEVSPAANDEAVVEATEIKRVFGDFIFSGEFANQPFIGFNPDYEVSIGDKVSLQLWGAFDFTGQIPVDAQGNLFIPKVGPVNVSGVKNKDLNRIVTEAITGVFKKNVGVYASLDGAEPIKVYVAGFVRQPGLYAGHASDSVLFFLDRAGGIDSERGSYLNVKVLRGGKTYREVNLYDFVLDGYLPQFQFSDGDTVVVSAVTAQVGVLGEAQNPYLFEFSSKDATVADILALARPFPQATHVRINRNDRAKVEVEYVELAKANDVKIHPGDVLELISDKQQGTISIRVEGEHESVSEYILPYGARLGDVLSQVNFGENAQLDAIQLSRVSVKERQREALEAQLVALQNSVLTARSNTVQEASLRAQEAQLVLQWVERARAVEPKGIVSLARSTNKEDILLEPGDIIRIPRKSNFVMVHGDVLFPSAMAYQKGSTIRDYIDQAGGLSQPRGAVNILLLRRDGTFDKLTSSEVKSKKFNLQPGDEIFVLPRVQTKSLQIATDVLNIFYQLALSAGVVLGI
ncbi:polysaccharide biosynthesis/export family protein [Kordiimonas sp. SCSIO 12610]|uniref:polysaccharide biosynthesis/export family protein n=1 Tax=Kordiimonas sp. SCSIO 12610 TaxID=2829597 RepID=UPI00210964E1|nr:polysaccharide biosynthesis/export family protein [Kordiimonas sp. SCSIO 12610]UTW56255.1 SLBB domain-containing protein [Kordiimonas sp. SCSIO 12610]